VNVRDLMVQLPKLVSLIAATILHLQASVAFRFGLPVVSCEWLRLSAMAKRLLDVQHFMFIPASTWQSESLALAPASVALRADVALHSALPLPDRNTVATTSVGRQPLHAPNSSRRADLGLGYGASLQVSASILPRCSRTSSRPNSMTSSKKKDNCHENCFLTASMDTDETSTPYQIGVARRAPFDDITNTLPAPCTNTGQHVTVRKRQRQCQSRIMSGSKDEIGDQNEPPVEALTAAVAAIEMMTNPEAVPTGAMSTFRVAATTFDYSSCHRQHESFKCPNIAM
jgi:hypothetical protein